MRFMNLSKIQIYCIISGPAGTTEILETIKNDYELMIMCYAASLA